MVIGGDTDDFGRLDDIELVPLDDTPVPECLSELNPFPLGSITNAAGAAISHGKYEMPKLTHLFG